MSPKVKIITAYDYEAQAENKPGVHFDPDDPNSKSVTNQSDLDSTDINKQFARYEKTGMIPDLLTGDNRVPQYGDFTNVGDFHQLQIRLARVQQAFDALPVAVRNRFKNDPHELVEFLADPKNDTEAIKLGLKKAEISAEGAIVTKPGTGAEVATGDKVPAADAAGKPA